VSPFSANQLRAPAIDASDVEAVAVAVFIS
jgi:hypothetical protein